MKIEGIIGSLPPLHHIGLSHLFITQECICFNWILFLFQFGIAGLSLLGHDERLFKVNPVFCMPEAVIERLGIKIQQLKI